MAVSLRRDVPLTIQACSATPPHRPRPAIFHADNGSEYMAAAFVAVLEQYGVCISRTHPGGPWENGSQGSFSDTCKVNLGDPPVFF